MLRAARRAIAGALFALAFVAPVVADPTYPALTGRVVDGADLLSPGTEARLSATLEAHEKATSNQIVVVTLPSLQDYEIEEFGVGLARAWGIGQAGRNNGVLLIVAPKERRVRIEVGYGLEGVLTDAISHDIIENRILPRFRGENYEAGIEEGAAAILAAVAGAYEPVATTDWNVESLVPFFMFLAFVAIAMATTIHGYLEYKRQGGGRDFWGYWGEHTGGGGIGGGWSSGRGRSSGGGFRGGGGSFGGGGSSGRW